VLALTADKGGDEKAYEGKYFMRQYFFPVV
jgi:hypothetical protein